MNIKLLQLILSFLFCIAFNLAVSQNKPLRFNHLSVDDGLSQNSVRCILQDNKGFMWFGTEEGLNRYNGYKFIVYQNIANDSTSLSANELRSILEDQQGNIWVGTTNGLNILDRNKNTFSRIRLTSKDDSHAAARNFIFTLFEDRDGDVWIGTQDGFYLFHRKEKRYELFDHLLPEHVIKVRSFFQDSESVYFP